VGRPGHFGKLYCHIDVVVPKKLSARSKELLVELSAEMGDSETSDADELMSQNFGEKVKDFFKGK
ncbi:MAG: hypothetical protein FWD93_04715, partial [Coriobacteriia bacterium]|nr:hypothetical protein [Coriobacteriia bacterium]